MQRFIPFLLVLSLTSQFANADWKPILGIGSGVTSNNYSDVTAATFNDNDIIIIYTDALCSGTDITEYVLNVNETPVNMAFACVSGKEVVGASTERGREFIFNEFKSKNIVTIGKWIFSAKGFLKAREVSIKNAKNAL